MIENRLSNKFNGVQVAVGDIVTVVEGTGTRYKVAQINEGVATLKDAKGKVAGKKKADKLKVEKKAADKKKADAKKKTVKESEDKKDEKKDTKKTGKKPEWLEKAEEKAEKKEDVKEGKSKVCPACKKKGKTVCKCMDTKKKEVKESIQVGNIVTVVEGSGKSYRVSRINEDVAILKDAKGNVVGKKKVDKLKKVTDLKKKVKK